MPDSSPPPVPSPTTTPACPDDPPCDDCLLRELESPTPSAPPAPAPASELEEWERLLHAVEAAVKRHEREASASSSVSWHVAKEAFRRHCTESRVAQLVVAARDAERLDWLAQQGAVYGPWVDYECVHAFEWQQKHDGPLREFLDREVAARASRPTEETDGGQQQEQGG